MSSEAKTETKPRKISSYILLGAALYVFIESFSLLSPILLSFLLTFLIAIAVNPVVYKIRDWTGGRKGAAIVMALGILIGASLAIWAFIGPLKTATTTIVTKLPGYLERLQIPGLPSGGQTNSPAASTNSIASNATASTNAAPTKPGGAGGGNPNSLMSGLTGMLQSAASAFKAMALNASQIFVVLITVFFGVTFTLMQPRPVFVTIFGMIPERHHTLTAIILKRIGQFLPTWALATMTAMFTVGMLVFLLMWPFFGFMDAAVLGIIAMVFEAVPYLGPLLSSIPALFFALGKGGMTPVWVCALYLVVQLLENNLIIPVIMARGMKLHPVAVMFSILLCVETFGILGVVIASPMVAIAQILHEEIYRKRFLPTTSEADLQQLAQSVLRDQQHPAQPKA